MYLDPNLSELASLFYTTMSSYDQDNNHKYLGIKNKLFKKAEQEQKKETKNTIE